MHDINLNYGHPVIARFLAEIVILFGGESFVDIERDPFNAIIKLKYDSDFASYLPTSIKIIGQTCSYNGKKEHFSWAKELIAIHNESETRAEIAYLERQLEKAPQRIADAIATQERNQRRYTSDMKRWRDNVNEIVDHYDFKESSWRNGQLAKIEETENSHIAAMSAMIEHIESLISDIPKTESKLRTLKARKS